MPKKTKWRRILKDAAEIVLAFRVPRYLWNLLGISLFLYLFMLFFANSAIPGLFLPSPLDLPPPVVSEKFEAEEEPPAPSNGARKNGGTSSLPPVQASFTETFSGIGWKNSAASTAYQDFKVTLITAPPLYDWIEDREVSALLRGRRVIAAASDGTAGLALFADGGVLLLRPGGFLLRENVLPQAGKAYLARDPQSASWIAALVAENRLRIYSLGESGLAVLGERSREFDAPAAADPTGDLVCASGECLLALPKGAFRFRADLADLREEPKVKEFAGGALSVAGGVAGGNFIVGWTDRGEDHESNVLLLSPAGELLGMEKGIFKSKYPGVLRFGYDPDGKKILAVYAAYEGQAVILPQDLSRDGRENVSRYFGARVFGGPQTEIRTAPEIKSFEGDWWIFSRADSVPKLLKIAGGAATDFTPLLAKDLQRFFLFWYGSREAYALGSGPEGTAAHRFEDRGYKWAPNFVWESLALNGGDKDVVNARFTGRQGEGSLRYLLSNDGGRNWTEARVGERVNFKERGRDLRFRVELYPTSRYRTPWVDVVGVEYFEAR